MGGKWNKECFSRVSPVKGDDDVCVCAPVCVCWSHSSCIYVLFFPIMSHKSSLSQDNMFAIFTGINIHVGGGRAALVAFVCLFCQWRRWRCSDSIMNRLNVLVYGWFLWCHHDMYALLSGNLRLGFSCEHVVQDSFTCCGWFSTVSTEWMWLR